jgi:uncharacterized protein (DUF983 family)
MLAVAQKAPQAGYGQECVHMSLLDYPRCPQCQGEVPIQRLYKEAPTLRGGLLIGDGSEFGGVFTIGTTGIVCPTCGAKLRVLQTGVAMAAMSTLMIGMPILVGPFALLMAELAKTHDSGWLVLLLLPPAALVVILFNRLPPRFARLRLLGEGERAAFPLSENREATEPTD